MRNTEVFIFLSLLTLLLCCKHSDNTRIVIVECNGKVDSIELINNYDSDKKLIETTHTLKGIVHGSTVKYFPDGKIRESRVYNHGKLFGDDEIYFSNGGLQKYQFLIDSNTTTFIRAYNENGQCMSNTGNPRVFDVIGTNRKNDTLNIKFIFADKIFSNFEVEISSDGKVYSKISFKNCDQEFPFNKVFDYVQDISEEKRIRVFLKMRGIDMFTKENLVYYDTLDMTKK